MTPFEIARLPIGRLCCPGALVALWCTNRERLRRFVETDLFSAWGLDPVAEWLWLKTDAEETPVGGLAATDSADRGDDDEADGAGGAAGATSCPRRPYEPLVLARFVGIGAARGVAAQSAGLACDPPAKAVLVARVQEHSRKPRLGSFLRGAVGKESARQLP